MPRIDIDIIIKCFLLNVYTFIVFFRIRKTRQIGVIKRFIVITSVVITSLIYLFMYPFFATIVSAITISMLQSIILNMVIGNNASNTFSSVIIARTIVFVLFAISASIEYIIQITFGINNLVINILFTYSFEAIVLYLILKSRRLKNGLSFLNTQNEYIEIVLVNIAIILVLVQGLIGYDSEKSYKHLYFYYIIIGLFMIFMIYKTITMHYKQKLVDDTINQYKKDIEEKDNEIKRLTDEVFKVSKINHEFYSRQKSLELMVKNALQNSNMEAAEEQDIMDRISKITKEHLEKMEEIKSLTKLPKTDIPELDDMFKYMQNECDKSGISFKLQINGNIHSLINNFIPKNKLETLIGDHIRDAIIAINYSDNSYKEIMVVLGLKDNCYELSIFDTGIEFEIETLLNLGLKPITTHKDSGGSGIGFITTFETLKECKASLIIDEKHGPKDNDYTKSVSVRFDGKSEYRIKSYRAEEIYIDKETARDKELIVREIN